MSGHSMTSVAHTYTFLSNLPDLLTLNHHFLAKFATLGIDNRFHIYHSLTDALQAIGHLLSVEFVSFKFK